MGRVQKATPTKRVNVQCGPIRAAKDVLVTNSARLDFPHDSELLAPFMTSLHSPAVPTECYHPATHPHQAGQLVHWSVLLLFPKVPIWVLSLVSQGCSIHLSNPAALKVFSTLQTLSTVWSTVCLPHYTVRSMPVLNPPAQHRPWTSDRMVLQRHPQGEASTRNILLLR